MRKHLLNMLGITLGFAIIICGLFFTLWQLDIILSGCVWWESSATGTGWHWDGPGAYQREYFQCFLWKTTIGQAYDTLFLFNFFCPIIGTALVFISVWKWEDEK